MALVEDMKVVEAGNIVVEVQEVGTVVGEVEVGDSRVLVAL
jgi:hypothetical protein